MLFAKIGGQHREPLIALEALEQVRDFDVGVPVVSVGDSGTLAHEGVGLVEEEGEVRRLGDVEHAGQILLRLSDVLADQVGEIDLVKVDPEIRRDTSAASVLPVPEGPAKRATTPAEGSGEKPHSPNTVSRWRQRRATSCTWSARSASRTRSSQVRVGRIRSAAASNGRPPIAE